MVLSDYNLQRVHEAHAKLGDPGKYPVEWIGAGEKEQIMALARKHGMDLILCDFPRGIREMW